MAWLNEHASKQKIIYLDIVNEQVSKLNRQYLLRLNELASKQKSASITLVNDLMTELGKTMVTQTE